MNASMLHNPHDRRSDHDVTNTVQVSSVEAVRAAVQTLFEETFPGAPFDPVWLAFHDFDALFSGREPGYVGCDTSYHDRQHTLDMVLAMARLIAGHERAAEPADRLGAQRATMGLITALFHDAGYVRHQTRDAAAHNGAEYSLNHVSRSAIYLRHYFERIGLPEWGDVAAQIVHYTGYEVSLDQIELADPRDCIIGHLLGTADLLAQMADRCYLEKCRDRLFPEFVLGGIAIAENSDGGVAVNYRSGRDLLRKTLSFYRDSAQHRLLVTFNRAYRYMELVFDGTNPYTDAINRNLEHLRRVLENNDWALLRRAPPAFTAIPDAEGTLQRLAARRIRSLADEGRIRLRGGPAARTAPQPPSPESATR